MRYIEQTVSKYKEGSHEWLQPVGKGEMESQQIFEVGTKHQHEKNYYNKLSQKQVKPEDIELHTHTNAVIT